MKEVEYGHIRLAQLTGADEVTVTGHRYARMTLKNPARDGRRALDTCYIRYG
jgi:hypothetical protein